MKETDMAVVVSSSQGEIKKFKEKGLDIKPHRKRIVTEELDVKFKDPDDPFRIVFVCAMWMTGFDAPPVSTIYLDKPIRNHTLMQTISRANRVFEDKQSGIILDYYGILRKLNEALAIYGSGTGGGIREGDTPLRQVDELAKLLEKNLKLMEKYFEDKEIDPQRILLAKDFEQLRLIEETVEAILENDESKVLFFSLLKLVVDSYTDLLPDPKANEYRRLVSLYVVIGETIAGYIPGIDISDVEKKIEDLVDRSIAVKPLPPREPTKPILSVQYNSFLNMDRRRSRKPRANPRKHPHIHNSRHGSCYISCFNLLETKKTINSPNSPFFKLKCVHTSSFDQFFRSSMQRAFITSSPTRSSYSLVLAIFILQLLAIFSAKRVAGLFFPPRESKYMASAPSFIR